MNTPLTHATFRNLALSLTFGAGLILVGCSSDQTASVQPASNDQGATAGPLPEPANSPAPSTTSSSAPTPQSTSDKPTPVTSNNSGTSTYKPWTPAGQNSAPAATAAGPARYPTAILTDKKGYVKSPWAEHAGLVNVEGFPSGTVVKCPYTGKNFIVP